MSSTITYQIPSPIHEIHFPWAQERKLHFFCKRDDRIHAAVSGNKWRKLKYNLLQAKHLNKIGIVTFGGAFSNHILATAHACMTHGLASIGIIRGDELNASSNAILQQCQDWGMQFRFVSREEYNMKDDYEYINELKSELSSYFILPEGGKNFLGMVGCQEIVNEIDLEFDAIWLAQGTCTTSIGVAMSVNDQQVVHAVPALKGFDSHFEISQILHRQGLDAETINELSGRMVFHPDYHFGGYGKSTPELLSYIRNFQDEYRIPLDSVYTGKTMYAMTDFYQKNLMENQTVIFLHTGGLVAGKV